MLKRMLCYGIPCMLKPTCILCSISRKQNREEKEKDLQLWDELSEDVVVPAQKATSSICS
jgi:hypothetical protein